MAARIEDLSSKPLGSLWVHDIGEEDAAKVPGLKFSPTAKSYYTRDPEVMQRAHATFTAPVAPVQQVAPPAQAPVAPAAQPPKVAPKPPVAPPTQTKPPAHTTPKTPEKPVAPAPKAPAPATGKATPANSESVQQAAELGVPQGKVLPSNNFVKIVFDGSKYWFIGLSEQVGTVLGLNKSAAPDSRGQNRHYTANRQIAQEISQATDNDLKTVTSASKAVPSSADAAKVRVTANKEFKLDIPTAPDHAKQTAYPYIKLYKDVAPVKTGKNETQELAIYAAVSPRDDQTNAILKFFDFGWKDERKRWESSNLLRAEELFDEDSVEAAERFVADRERRKRISIEAFLRSEEDGTPYRPEDVPHNHEAFIVQDLDPVKYDRSFATHPISYKAKPKTYVDEEGRKHNIALKPHQEAAVEFVLDNKGVLVGDEMGLGKAQPNSEPILTPYGWKLMGDIRIGDEVIGSSGAPIKVTGVYPQGRLPVFKVKFSDGATTRCCDDHLWAVNSAARRHKGNPNKVRPLKEIRTKLYDAAGNARHYIPVVQSVEFEDKVTLPLPPYLLGCILGDGGVTDNKRVRFSNVDEDILVAVKASLPVGYDIKHEDRCNYRIVGPIGNRNNLVMTALRYLGVMTCDSDNKFIPQDYLWASKDARRELLRGLLDTDGYVNDEGMIQFSSNSVGLADGVEFIVRSLGGLCKRSQKVSASEKDHFICTIALAGDWCPFSCARKAARWRPRVKYTPTRAITEVAPEGDEECTCIAVEASDHLYVTNNFIVTHNTGSSIEVINADPSIKHVLIICPKNVVYNWAAELNKFLDKGPNGQPRLTVGVANADKHSWPTTDIVILHFNVLGVHKNDVQRVWDYVICDEVHNIKNVNTVASQVMLGELDHKKRQGNRVLGRYMVGLSGTLFPNEPNELFASLNFVRPMDFQSREEWDDYSMETGWIRAQFERKDPLTGAVESSTAWVPQTFGPRNEDNMNKLLRQGGLREDGREIKPMLIARDASIIPLPPMHRKIEQIDNDDVRYLRDHHKGAYEALSKARKLEAEDHASGKLDTMFALESQLDKVRDVPTLRKLQEDITKLARSSFQDYGQLRLLTGLAKVPLIVRKVLGILKKDPTSKILVFTWHQEVLQQIKLDLQQAGYSSLVITGDTSAKKRYAQAQVFNTHPNARVCIATIAATKEGLNLIGANYVEFAELSMVPGHMLQAEKRAHRMGQQRPVHVGWNVAPGTLDDSMLRLNQMKSGYLENVFGNLQDGEIKPQQQEELAPRATA